MECKCPAPKDLHLVVGLGRLRATTLSKRPGVGTQSLSRRTCATSAAKNMALPDATFNRMELDWLVELIKADAKAMHSAFAMTRFVVYAKCAEMTREFWEFLTCRS